MRKMFVIALFILTTASSFASESKIFDLMYLPKEGTSFGIAEASLLKGLVEEKGPGYNYKADITGWNLQQTLGRSITDRLLISADINFLHQDTKSTITFDDSSTSSSGTSVKGLSDPTLNGRLRVIDSEVQLDILGAVLIATGNKIFDGSEQNNKQGGNELSLGAQAGVKMDDLQIAGGFGVTRSMKSTDEDIVQKVKYKNNEHNSYKAEFSALAKLTDESLLKVTGGGIFSDQYKDNQGGVAASMTQLYGGGELQLLLNQDLLLRAGATLFEINTIGLDTYRILLLNGGLNFQF